jgi:hypothetical protein
MGTEVVAIAFSRGTETARVPATDQATVFSESQVYLRLSMPQIDSKRISSNMVWPDPSSRDGSTGDGKELRSAWSPFQDIWAAR